MIGLFLWTISDLVGAVILAGVVVFTAAIVLASLLQTGWRWVRRVFGDKS